MNPILKLARYTNIIVGCGLSGAYFYVKHNNFSNCKQMLEERKDDPTLQLTPDLKKLVNEVIRDMKLQKDVVSKIKFFLSETSDFQRHGSLENPEGALIGIPQYFVIDQNTTAKIYTVVEKRVTHLEDSKSLSYSLQLTPEAQKFAIARELYELIYSNQKILYFFPPAVCLNSSFISYLLETVAKKKGLKISLSVHSAFFLAGASLYVMSFDLTMLYTETDADFKTCDLGKSYIAGGIEYYKKMMNKNKAIKLADKKAPYSEDGDVSYTILGKHHMPLQQRLRYLEDIYKLKRYKPFIWKYILFAH